jgi:hypothetical protein
MLAKISWLRSVCKAKDSALAKVGAGPWLANSNGLVENRQKIIAHVLEEATYGWWPTGLGDQLDRLSLNDLCQRSGRLVTIPMHLALQIYTTLCWNELQRLIPSLRLQAAEKGTALLRKW